MLRAFFPTLFCGETCDTLELRELQKLATQIRFGAGKTIFSEGEAADHVFGLSQGVVRLYKILPDGRRQFLAFALPRDFLGMPLADQHNFLADAIGEERFWIFPHPDFVELAELRWRSVAEGLNPSGMGDVPGLPPSEQIAAEVVEALEGLTSD